MTPEWYAANVYHSAVIGFSYYSYFFLQARGPKKHLKRLAAPKSWMLDKLGGVFAPRPSTGPHKLRESLPMVVFLRNRLKYALNNSEVTKIVMQRLIKVDGKVRTDPTYPAGFMGKKFILRQVNSLEKFLTLLGFFIQRCYHH